MASEKTYAKARFKNESKSPGTNSDSPEVLFQKYSQHLEENMTLKGLVHTEVECVKSDSTIQEKVWSCCPKDWKSFSSHCYFISTDSQSWNESRENCSRMEAHLLVINTKEEQDFIIENLQIDSTYYIGLSDPEGRRLWQWVDQTPYDETVKFWQEGEPNNEKEQCVELNYFRYGKWGWNDVPCHHSKRTICEMMKIYLEIAHSV
ncbi:PREDICTED: C-type lectin domain family 4 member A-like isoform X2 [Chinchilla lanigera]|uniref:C-type lectin domain family 4 member A-like isoform X2 n=1 Tax=Chinchilla lanigera TaxID=34839 RepID=UPI00038F0F21|nr:PREDICTED: C-type lectin domain family 4 member A-like isoform X2 [Chinchilla lanigera]